MLLLHAGAPVVLAAAVVPAAAGAAAAEGISDSMSQMVRLCELGVEAAIGGGSCVEYFVGVAALAM